MITLILGIVIIVIILIYISIQINDSSKAGLCFGLLFLGIFVLVGSIYNFGIEKGALEMAKGNIQVKLISHPDSTRTWEIIKEFKK